MDSFVTLKSKTKSEEKKDKKINKYLISSEDDSDQDITPSKKLKSWSKNCQNQRNVKILFLRMISEPEYHSEQSIEEVGISLNEVRFSVI